MWEWINSMNTKIDWCDFTVSAMMYITIRLDGPSHAIASQDTIGKGNSIVHLVARMPLSNNRIFLKGIKVMRPDQRIKFYGQPWS